MPIPLLCATACYIVRVCVFKNALLDKVFIYLVYYSFSVRCIGVSSRVHVIPGVSIPFVDQQTPMGALPGALITFTVIYGKYHMTFRCGIILVQLGLHIVLGG